MSLSLRPPPLTPLTFFIEVLVLMSLGAALVAVAWGEVDPLTMSWRAAAEPFVRRERHLAAGLGWSLRTWLSVRAAVVAVGLGVGLSTGIPVAVFGGVAGAVFAFPWVMSARAERRRLRTERAFVAMVREIRDRMLANTAFDQALRDVAGGSTGELRTLLQPLVGDAPIAEALVEVDRRANSPLATLICVTFLVARTRDQGALIDILSRTLLPAASSALLIEAEGEVTLAQQRTIIYIMLLIQGGSLWYVSSVPTFHSFYSDVLGQATLVVVAAIFLGLVYAIGRIMRRPEWTQWDVVAVREEFEARRNG